MAQDIDLAALARGDKASWDAFVRRYAGLVIAAVRGVARDGTDFDDLAQEVFLRLCKDGFRLIKTYDPTRAALSTWLTIVARSTARFSSALNELFSPTVPRTTMPCTPSRTSATCIPWVAGKSNCSPKSNCVVAAGKTPAQLQEGDVDIAAP